MAPPPETGRSATLSQLLADWAAQDLTALDRLVPTAVIGISPVTVRRDWTTAKAWLYHELTT